MDGEGPSLSEQLRGTEFTIHLPFTSDVVKDLSSQARNYVLQGETVRFYMIASPGANAPPPLVEALMASVNPQVRVTASFDPEDWEKEPEDVADSASQDGIDDDIDESPTGTPRLAPASELNSREGSTGPSTPNHRRTPSVVQVMPSIAQQMGSGGGGTPQPGAGAPSQLLLPGAQPGATPSLLQSSRFHTMSNFDASAALAVPDAGISGGGSGGGSGHVRRRSLGNFKPDDSHPQQPAGGATPRQDVPQTPKKSANPTPANPTPAASVTGSSGGSERDDERVDRRSSVTNIPPINAGPGDANLAMSQRTSQSGVRKLKEWQAKRKADKQARDRTRRRQERDSMVAESVSTESSGRFAALKARTPFRRGRNQGALSKDAAAAGMSGAFSAGSGSTTGSAANGMVLPTPSAGSGSGRALFTDPALANMAAHSGGFGAAYNAANEVAKGQSATGRDSSGRDQFPGAQTFVLEEGDDEYVTDNMTVLDSQPKHSFFPDETLQSLLSHAHHAALPPQIPRVISVQAVPLGPITPSSEKSNLSGTPVSISSLGPESPESTPQAAEGEEEEEVTEASTPAYKVIRNGLYHLNDGRYVFIMEAPIAVRPRYVNRKEGCVFLDVEVRPSDEWRRSRATGDAHFHTGHSTNAITGKWPNLRKTSGCPHTVPTSDVMKTFSGLRDVLSAPFTPPPTWHALRPIRVLQPIVVSSSVPHVTVSTLRYWSPCVTLVNACRWTPVCDVFAG